MARFSVLIGLVLIVVSVAFAILTGTASFTVWIPAILGVVIALLGWSMAKGNAGNVWGIRVVAAIGLVACAIQLVKHGFNLASHGQQAQLITAALCLLVIMRSFSKSEPPQSEGPEWGRLTKSQRRLR
jgi:uncharacterized membrane protein